MEDMQDVRVRGVLVACLTGALVLCAAGPALAYTGDTHLWAGQQATWLFTHGVDQANPTCITEDRGGWSFYPELLLTSTGWDPNSSYDPGADDERNSTYFNWQWIAECSKRADNACPSTLNHFWLLSDGLHDDPGWDTNNSWEVSYNLWVQAIDAWNAGDLAWAYTNLGYCMHHIQDMLQPAHSNDDLHPGDGTDGGDDCLEEWFLDIEWFGAMQMFSWDLSTGPRPPDVIPYPDLSVLFGSNADILQDIYNAGIADVADFPYLAQPAYVYNMQKYFYMLYWANQFGSWFASDDVSGQAYDPTGWLCGYPGFPQTLPGGQNAWNREALANNDDPCPNGNPYGRCRSDECDCDYDLTTIAWWCYGGIFKASPMLIEVFRVTVDVHAPNTTTEVARDDGKPVVEWNNSPVTLRLTGATDEANEGMRASGVWKVWGLCDGEPPADHASPSWRISQDGKHLVECLSTDWCGNTEASHDIPVWVDLTPPDVTFPDLRPNYLTSETFTATWVATDATSGIASVDAYFDGVPVTDGQVFDLSLMAGVHALRVIATDLATNVRDVTFTMEVWIDVSSWAKPVYVNDRTKGIGLQVVVEFPGAYDVSLVALPTCILSVKGSLDLTQGDPVVAEKANLKGELLTGVGDHDEDGTPDRMIRFNKKLFVKAVGGQTGDIPAIVSGGLLPGGSPRFLGVLAVPVFKAPPK
jgi:hypothetical protein